MWCPWRRLWPPRGRHPRRRHPRRRRSRKGARPGHPVTRSADVGGLVETDRAPDVAERRELLLGEFVEELAPEVGEMDLAGAAVRLSAGIGEDGVEAAGV